MLETDRFHLADVQAIKILSLSIRFQIWWKLLDSEIEIGVPAFSDVFSFAAKHLVTFLPLTKTTNARLPNE